MLVFGSSGLTVLDITDPTSPGILGSLDLGDYISAVALAGDLAYLASLNGLYVVNLASRSDPQLLGSLEIFEVGEDIAVLAEMSGFPFYRNQLKVYSPWLASSSLEARVTAPHGGEVIADLLHLTHHDLAILLIQDVERLLDGQDPRRLDGLPEADEGHLAAHLRLGLSAS